MAGRVIEACGGSVDSATGGRSVAGAGSRAAAGASRADARSSAPPRVRQVVIAMSPGLQTSWVVHLAYHGFSPKFKARMVSDRG